MGGTPFKVGRFAHSLRVRLMREHLGIDIDALDENELDQNIHACAETDSPEVGLTIPDRQLPSHDAQEGEVIRLDSWTHLELRSSLDLHAADPEDSHSSATSGNSDPVELPRHSGSAKTGENQTAQYKNGASGFAKEGNVVTEQPAGRGQIDVDQEAHDEKHGFDSDFQGPIKDDGVLTEALAQDNEHRSTRATNGAILPQPDREQFRVPRAGKTEEKESVTSESRSSIRKRLAKTWAPPMGRPHVQADKFEDPISDAFWKDVWVASAEYNVGTLLPASHLLTQDDFQTEIYRKVFHAIPDDTVTTWKQYTEFTVYHERLNKPVHLRCIKLVIFCHLRKLVDQ